MEISRAGVWRDAPLAFSTEIDISWYGVGVTSLFTQGQERGRVKLRRARDEVGYVGRWRRRCSRLR